MTKRPREHAGILVVTTVALLLLGQLAAVSPARATQAPASADARAVSEQTTASAVETRRAATLTLEAPLAAPAVEPAVLPSTRDGWSVLMTEGFEGTFPGPGWVAFDNDGATNGEYFWAADDFQPYSGTRSAWPAAGGADGVDPSSSDYPNYLDSWMVYGPFDLSGYTAAELDFWYRNESETNYDYFFWGGSADGTNFNGMMVSGDSAGWVQVTFDLAAHLGDSSVWIAFVFQSDVSVTYNGPFVDDVQLRVYSGAAPGAFAKTSPADGAAGVALNASLSWSASSGAASYEYCLDTTDNNACDTAWVSAGANTSAPLAGLATNTGYWWQVRANNASGTTYADGAAGAHWGFTTTAVAPSRAWTYLVYLDGDNNLEAALVDDFLEMAAVGSTAEVAIVVQFDRIPGYDTRYGDWTDTHRFLVTAGMTPTAESGTSIGEVNMGDPATLVNFVQWASSTYPAANYALVLANHGSGWRERALSGPSVQGIAYDDTSGGDGLQMDELRSALNTITGGGAQPLALVGMDACLMAMIEVADQLRPYAGVLAASQDTEPWEGWPHDTILAALVANPAMTPAALGTVVVDEYYASYGNSQTQSAVDLGADYAALRTAVDGFAAALLANGAAHAADIQVARGASQTFEYGYYLDLWDFADRVQAAVADTAIDNAAQAVKSAVDGAVIRERSGPGWPGAHGISIYFPGTAAEYDTRYDGSSGFLQFTAATRWDEWIHAYHAYGSAGPANDDFDSPILIGGSPYANTQDVSLATTAGDDPALRCSADDPRYRTVWYRYTASAPQTLTIDTFGSDFDTVLAVWTGSRGSLANVACNDDSGGFQSRVQLDAPVGTTFHIEIASYGTAGGELILNLAAVVVSLPGAFGKTSPSSGAVDLEQPVTLSWGESPGATSYEYCYDATNDGACTEWVNTGASTSWTVSPTPGISYWQVRARNAAGLTYANGGPTSYWSFEASSIGFWAMLAPMSAARPGAAVAAVGGKVYAIGGFDGLTVVQAYNPASNTWATRSAKPTGVRDAGAAVIDGIIYVAGGHNGTTQVAALEAYNPATNTWTARAPLPAAVQGAAVVAVDSKLYVIGGYAGSTYLSSCHAYDQPTNTWATCSSLPGAPAYAAAGAIDGKIYIWGGQLRALPYSFESTSPYTGFIQRYDPATNTWATVVNFYPSGQELAYGAAAVYDGRLYRCGGERHTSTSIPGSVPQLWAHQYYTTSTCSTYEPGVGIDYGSFPHMQEARRRHGLVELGGYLYAVGGYAAGAERALLPGAPPGAFSKSSPANGATGVALNPTLSWGTSSGAASYEYCYDTTDDGVCAGVWIGTGTATSAPLTGLAYSTTYWWQARATNGFGTTYADGGAWRSFTTTGLTILEMSFRSIGAQDGWVLESGEDTTKGSDVLNATATTSRLGDDAGDRQYRSILAFDTSGLPAGAVVTGITIKIKRQSMVGINPFTIDNPNQKKGLNLLKVDMQAGYYHDNPALEKFDFHAIGVRGNVGRFIKTPTDRWYRAPLRAACYGLLNLSGVTQFRLRFDLDDNDNMAADYLSFYTGDYGTPADRPELIVNYYLP